MQVTMRWGHNRFPDIQKRLPKALQEMALEIAEGVATEARDAAPVRTGRLRDSIVAETTSEGAAAYTDVEYAPYVEYGHDGRAPHPFFTQAAENRRDDPAMYTLEERL